MSFDPTQLSERDIELGQACLKAAEELGFDAIAPFQLPFRGRIFRYAALIKGLNCRKGTLVRAMEGQFSPDQCGDIWTAAGEAGYIPCNVCPLLCKYDRKEFVSWLNLFEWYRPAWHNGPPLLGVWSLRTTLKPGDLGEIIRLHGRVYAQEYGLGATFEQYVAAPLIEFLRAPSEREHLWIAEIKDQIVGSIAIVADSDDVAQLRWFLVHPLSRGNGLGQMLLQEALAFCRSAGYRSVFLWTISNLTTAARKYHRAGFRKTESKAGNRWGVDVVEEKYELDLSLRDLSV